MRDTMRSYEHPTEPVLPRRRQTLPMIPSEPVITNPLPAGLRPKPRGNFSDAGRYSE